MIQKIKNIGHYLNALLAVTWYGHPAKKLQVIGVTGTDGKTTTSSLIYHILKKSDLKVALVSTVAAYIGNEEIDTGFHTTTPSPWSLQKLLNRISDQNFNLVVLEATSHGLDQHRLLGTNIKIGVITNITREHLDYHHNYDSYLKAKAKIFNRASTAILNQDDVSYTPLLDHLNEHRPKINLTSYSQKKEIEAKSKFPTLSQEIKSKFPEDYNQANALAAFKTCQHFGVTEEQFISGLKTFPGVIGRMEEIHNNRGIRVIVDFAHTPNSLEQALLSLKQTTKGRLIAIYGKAGLRDPFNRPVMANIGSKIADLVILTAEDPRVENVNTIIYQMKQGVEQNHDRILSIADRMEAINFVINKLAKTGDTVGIFGKGHERSMNLDGITETPWYDQSAAKKALGVNIVSKK